MEQGKSLLTYRADARRVSHLVDTERLAFLKMDQTPCSIPPSSQRFHGSVLTFLSPEYFEHIMRYDYIAVKNLDVGLVG